MGKKNLASSYVHGENYKLQSEMTVTEELATPSVTAYPLSDNVEEYGKLNAKSVFDKIINREFLIAHPEKTKTSRATASRC